MQNTESTAKSFLDLIVWQKGHQLVLRIYDLTDPFPRRETYGVVKQIRDAAVSICTNIAEGFKRRGKLDKARFMNISQGSLEEVRYLLILSRDRRYAQIDDVMPMVDEVAELQEAYRQAILDSRF